VRETDKIYLVGFMGAGKSTLARALAARLGWRVEDVDDRIEARERRTISEIFRTEGEAYFRAVERSVLYGLLPVRAVVVATGGGTFIDPENRAAMLADGFVVWLDLPFDAILARVPTDGRRPLAVDRESLLNLYVQRRALYEMAHLRLEAGTLVVDELVECVLDRLGW
jgi:shikimate kinase